MVHQSEQDTLEARQIQEDEQPGPGLQQAGQALFRLGRMFGRHPVKEQLQRQVGRGIQLSHVLITEAVASGPSAFDGEVTVGVIAERLAIDPSTASRLVAEAIGAGFLVRIPSQTDNRRLCLKLTDAGHQLVDHAHRYQRSVFEHVTRDWTQAEQQEFARLLIRFVDAIAQMQVHAAESDRA